MNCYNDYIIIVKPKEIKVQIRAVDGKNVFYIRQLKDTDTLEALFYAGNKVCHDYYMSEADKMDIDDLSPPKLLRHTNINWIEDKKFI